MTTTDSIEIAGAGPAGLSAAITLSRAGYNVVVHEMRKEVGARFAGDFQGLENWSSKQDVMAIFKDQGIQPTFRYLACSTVTAYDNSRKPYTIRSDEPLFYLVERGPGPETLDSALLSQAQELGVEVRFNNPLRQISAKGILAAGPKVADAIAVGYHFRTNMPDGCWVICDDRLAPKGYAYLLIMHGRGTVKSCMFADFKKAKMYAQRVVAAFQDLLGLKLQNPRFHCGSGNFHVPGSGYSGNHPQVGEQAGFQDTLWGFGIRLAVSSGILAANSIIQDENYDDLWHKVLKPQMDVSILNRKIFSLVGINGYKLFLNWVARSRNPRHLLYMQYQPTWYKKIFIPLAKRHYSSLRSDRVCSNADCHRVWCRGDCLEEGGVLG